jgi:hypothetical protein
MRVRAKKGELLYLKTENDPRGVVSWGGHVAPAVRVEDTIVVLDPAIDPLGPMPMLRWLGLQPTSLSDVVVALCRDYADDSGCFAETPVEPQLEDFLHKVLSDLYSDTVTVAQPIYVIGSAFVSGLTIVHIVGNVLDQCSIIDHVTTRSMLIHEEYPSGEYRVTVFNGTLPSKTLALRIE